MDGNLRTFRLRDIESIRFSDDGEEVTAAQVFSLLYRELDPAIEYRLYGGSQPYAQSVMDPQRDPVLRELRENWSESVRNLNITANISFRSGQEVTANVQPRTNFIDYKKRPNIAHMTLPESDERLVLREARTYPAGDLNEVFKKSERYCGTKAAKADYPAMLQGASFEEGKAYVLPEPALLRTLEQMYLFGFPRITPSFKEIDSADGTMHYVRAFYNQVQDVGIFGENAQALGRYFGALHSLGLFDNADGQGDHYVLSNRSANQQVVVNIDPDFMLYAPHSCGTMRELRERFKPGLIELSDAVFKRDLKMDESQIAMARNAYSSKDDYLDFRESFQTILKNNLARQS